MQKVLVSVGLCGLAAVSAESFKGSVKQLDPWDYRDLEFYLPGKLGEETYCYQIWPGARLAVSESGVNSTAGGCKENWEEKYDLGNFDGYTDEELGNHHSGGSRLGCSSWFKMFEDSSLDAPEIKVSEDMKDGNCDTFVVLSAPPSAFKQEEAEAQERISGDAKEAKEEASKESVKEFEDEAAKGSVKQLDPWDYRDLEFYLPGKLGEE